MGMHAFLSTEEPIMVLDWRMWRILQGFNLPQRRGITFYTWGAKDASNLRDYSQSARSDASKENAEGTLG